MNRLINAFALIVIITATGQSQGQHGDGTMSNDLFGFLMRKIDTAMDLDVCVMTAIQTVMPEITRRCTTLSSCTVDCPFGYTVDQTTNCTNCACKTDPCLSNICPAGTVCRVQYWPKGTEKNHTFKAVGVCASVNKIGTCPSMVMLQQMIQGGWSSSSCNSTNKPSNECADDADCMSAQKCCSDGCNYKCMLPDMSQNETLCRKLQRQLGREAVQCTSRGTFKKKQYRVTRQGRNIAWCVDANGISILEYMKYDNSSTALNCDAFTVPNCTTLNCSMTCPYGYTRGADGCIACLCKTDPCAALNCDVDKSCQMVEVPCANQCPPVAQCVQIANLRIPDNGTNYGSCPYPTQSGTSGTPSIVNCHLDDDCPADNKCCPDDRGRTISCVDPIPTNNTCHVKRRAALNQLADIAQNCDLLTTKNFHLPACTPDGMFQEIQCDENTGMCWCVNPQTGENVIRTMIRGVPDCENPGNPYTADPEVCAMGVRVSRCPAVLCVVAKCPMHEFAACRINPCGGCTVEFFDRDNNKLTDCFGSGPCAMALDKQMYAWLEQLSYDRNKTCELETVLLNKIIDADKEMVLSRMRTDELIETNKELAMINSSPGTVEYNMIIKPCAARNFFYTPATIDPGVDEMLNSGGQQNQGSKSLLETTADFFPRETSETEYRIGLFGGYSTTLHASTPMQVEALRCNIPAFDDLTVLVSKMVRVQMGEKAESDPEKNVTMCLATTPVGPPEAVDMESLSDTMRETLWTQCRQVSRALILQTTQGLLADPMDEVLMDDVINSYEKEGICPDMMPNISASCLEDCSSHYDCYGNYLCCFNGCGHTCRNPTMIDRRTKTSMPYWPQCKVSGAYYDRQCRGNFCWCVDSNGTPKPGTFGNSSLECDVNGNVVDNSIGIIKCTSGVDPVVCPNTCTGIMTSTSPICTVDLCDNSCQESFRYGDGRMATKTSDNICLLPQPSKCITPFVTSWKFNYANAACQPVTGCATNFTDEASCEKSCVGTICPDGQQPCHVDPCASQSCPMWPEARCVVDECACAGTFVDGQQLVSREQCYTYQQPKSICLLIREKVQRKLRLLVDKGELTSKHMQLPICLPNGRFDETKDQKRSINATHAECVDYRGQTIPNTTRCNGDPTHCPQWIKLLQSQIMVIFQAPYSDDNAKTVKSSVMENVKKTGVLDSQISINVWSGSINTLITLNDDPSSPVDLLTAANSVQHLIQTNSFAVTLGGQNYVADPKTLKVSYTDSSMSLANFTTIAIPTTPTPQSAQDQQREQGAIAGVIIGVLVLGLIVSCVCDPPRKKSWIYRLYKKVRPDSSYGTAARKEITATASSSYRTPMHVIELGPPTPTPQGYYNPSFVNDPDANGDYVDDQVNHQLNGDVNSSADVDDVHYSQKKPPSRNDLSYEDSCSEDFETVDDIEDDRTSNSSDNSENSVKNKKMEKTEF